MDNLTETKRALRAGGPEGAAAAAQLLSHPRDFQQTVKDLGPLKSSPIFADARQDAEAIADQATPDAIGDQLRKDPDLSHYPPEMAESLAALRQVPDASLQKGLDGVAKNLLARSETARLSSLMMMGSGADPLSAENVRANPALAALVAPLAQSKDPATRAAIEDRVKGWSAAMMKGHMDAHVGGEPTTPEENAEASIAGFQEEMQAFAAQTGLGPVMQATMDEAMKGAASDILADSEIGLDALKNNPAYGQLINGVAADPAYADQVNAKARQVIEESVEARLEGKEGDEGVEQAQEEIMTDLKDVAGRTGLGEALNGQYGDVMEAKAGDFEDTANKGKNIFEKGLDMLESGLMTAVDFALESPFSPLAMTNIAPMALDAVGLDGVANVVEDFNDGSKAAMKATVQGVVHSALHPIETTQAMKEMVTDPGKLLEAGKGMWKEMSEHGVAYGLGYGATTLGTLFIPGGAAAQGLKGAGRLATLGVTKLESAAIPFASRGAGFLVQHGSKLATLGKEALENGALSAAKKAIDGPDAPDAVPGSVRTAGREFGGDAVNSGMEALGKARDLRARIGEHGLMEGTGVAAKARALRDAAGQPITTGKQVIDELGRFKSQLNDLRKDIPSTWRATDGPLPAKVKAEVEAIIGHVEKLADSKVVKGVEKGVAAYDAVTDPLGALKEKLKDYKLASGKSLNDRLEALTGALDDAALNLNPGVQTLAVEIVEDDQRGTLGG